MKRDKKYKKGINKNRKKASDRILSFIKRDTKYKKGINKNRNSCSTLRK